jgi:hypothetical protein
MRRGDPGVPRADAGGLQQATAELLESLVVDEHG